MRKKHCVKLFGMGLFVIVIALSGCCGPLQRVKINTSPQMNDEASINILMNKEGKFYFADNQGALDRNVIPFDEMITRSKEHWAKNQDNKSNKKWELKKIQTIEVYRATGCFDYWTCIDNECSCKRHKNTGEYCCACNCDCRP